EAQGGGAGGDGRGGVPRLLPRAGGGHARAGRPVLPVAGSVAVVGDHVRGDGRAVPHAGVVRAAGRDGGGAAVIEGDDELAVTVDDRREVELDGGAAVWAEVVLVHVAL